jgi:hypothetical protein
MCAERQRLNTRSGENFQVCSSHYEGGRFWNRSQISMPLAFLRATLQTVKLYSSTVKVWHMSRLKATKPIPLERVERYLENNGESRGDEARWHRLKEDWFEAKSDCQHDRLVLLAGIGSSSYRAGRLINFDFFCSQGKYEEKLRWKFPFWYTPPLRWARGRSWRLQHVNMSLCVLCTHDMDKT